MKQPHRTPTSCEFPLPASMLSRLLGFADLFTRPTWSRALLLLAGAVLAPGKRTVTAMLRILGRDQEHDFPAYHAVLSQAAWSSRAVAGRLLRLLVATFVRPDATVVIGLDDTIERRWGARIKARGIYRDPVRSSKGHFVKTSGLRWLSAQLLVQVPWAGRIMALPFLTLLAPSARFYAATPRAPKTLIDWARQAALQIHRWLPGRRVVMVADTAFAAIELLAAVRRHVCVVTRLRLDASLFAPAPQKRSGRGRPPVKGKRLPKLLQLLHDLATVWHRHTVALWYGRSQRTVEIASATAVWYHSGKPPVPIRWLLVRDPMGELEPQAFLATDLEAAPADILQWARRHPPMVRQPLAGRGHLPGNPRPSWRRDPASVVRPRHPAHHASPPRSLLSRHAMGARPGRASALRPSNRRLVSKAPTHLQRCHRRRPTQNLGPTDLFNLPGRRRNHGNSSKRLEPNGKRARLCCVIR